MFAGIPAACMSAEPALTAAVDTVDTARDMDRIRQALGLSTISFYGLSYGTVLGTVYASLFPHRLRTMVLDGAVDMYAPLATQAIERGAGRRAIARPSARRLRGRSGVPARSRPDRLLRPSCRRRWPPTRCPLPANGDDTPVTVGDLDTATLFAVSVPGFTPLYDSALVAAAHGDGSGLRSLALEFVVDIDSAPLVDAQWAITCNDTTGHPGPVAAGTLARSLGAQYPLIGAYAVNYNLGGVPGLAERPATGHRRTPGRRPTGPGARQHRRPQHAAGGWPAPGRRLPPRRPADLGRLGSHLAAQRVHRYLHADRRLPLPDRRRSARPRHRLPLSQGPRAHEAPGSAAPV